MDGLEGPSFHEEDYRVWLCQVGLRGQVFLRLASKP